MSRKSSPRFRLRCGWRCLLRKSSNRWESAQKLLIFWKSKFNIYNKYNITRTFFLYDMVKAWFEPVWVVRTISKISFCTILTFFKRVHIFFVAPNMSLTRRCHSCPKWTKPLYRSSDAIKTQIKKMSTCSDS